MASVRYRIKRVTSTITVKGCSYLTTFEPLPPDTDALIRMVRLPEARYRAALGHPPEWSEEEIEALRN